MTRSLPVVMAMLLLGACASAPVDESAAPFTEGVYRFSTSDEASPQSTDVSYDCSSGTCMASPSSRVVSRMSGTLVLHEDGSIRLLHPTYRCTEPSPRFWREADVRLISFTCNDARVTLNSSRGIALYTVERRSTAQGPCARYAKDLRGRTTQTCELYERETVTRRETIQINLNVLRVDAE